MEKHEPTQRPRPIIKFLGGVLVLVLTNGDDVLGLLERATGFKFAMPEQPIPPIELPLLGAPIGLLFNLLGLVLGAGLIGMSLVESRRASRLTKPTTTESEVPMVRPPVLTDVVAGSPRRESKLYRESNLEESPISHWVETSWFKSLLDRLMHSMLAFAKSLERAEPPRNVAAQHEAIPLQDEQPPATVRAKQEGITVEPFIFEGSVAHEARIAVVSWETRRLTVVARAKVRLVSGETIVAQQYTGSHSLLWIEPDAGMEGTLLYGQRTEFAFAVVGTRSSVQQRGVVFRVKVWESDSERDALIVRWTVGQFAPGRIEVDIAIMDAKSNTVYRFDRYGLYGDDKGNHHFEHLQELPTQLARVLGFPD